MGLKIYPHHLYPLMSLLLMFSDTSSWNPHHKFSVLRYVVGQPIYVCLPFLDCMRLSFNFLILNTFQRDRGQKHGLPFVSHGKEPVLVGSLVRDTIDKDCKRNWLLIHCLINKKRSFVLVFFFANKYLSLVLIKQWALNAKLMKGEQVLLSNKLL